MKREVTPSTHTESRLLPGLYITGPVVLGATWVTTIITSIAVTSTDDPDHDVKVGVACVPVFGPWIEMGYPGTYTAPLAVSGVLQAAGLAITIAGVTVRHTVRVADAPVSLTIVPTIGGAEALGTF